MMIGQIVGEFPPRGGCDRLFLEQYTENAYTNTESVRDRGREKFSFC
jgi:hypothetical protein